MVSQDDKDLKLYFESLKKLKGNFDKIGEYESLSPGLKKQHCSAKKDTPKLLDLKVLMDSVYQSSIQHSSKNW